MKQYTIRNIPADLDRVLRRRAKERGESFNQVALDALIAGAGLTAKPRRDLSRIIGSLSAEEAEALEKEVRLQRQIDPKLWR